MFDKLIDNIKVFFSKGFAITFESGDKAFIPTKTKMSIRQKLEIATCPIWEMEADSGEKSIEKVKIVKFKRRFRVF